MSARAHAAWQALRDAGLVNGDAPPASTQTPWYLQILLGVSAWIAAICLFGFLAVLVSDLLSNRPALLVLGLACCAGAIGLMRGASVEFLTQAAVPVSIVGQVLIGAAAFGDFPDDVGGWLAVGFAAGAMYALGPSWLHRFACGAALVIAACGVSGVVDKLAVFAVEPLLAWGAALAWASRDERVAPLAWAFGLGTFVVDAGVGFLIAQGHAINPGTTAQTVSATFAAMLLPVAALRLASERDLPRAPSVLLAIVGSMALAVLWQSAPGVAVGVAFALVGFAVDRPAVVVVGLAGAAACLARYYYQLDVTLLDKSGLLAGSGLLVLALRRVALYLEDRA